MPALNAEQVDAISGVLGRMWTRRKREVGSNRAKYTLSYAVSVRTGMCYVGYNDTTFDITGPQSARWQEATGYNPGTHYGYAHKQNACAEARALSVALSYDERLEDLVFFAMNTKGEPFHPCDTCRDWLSSARGVLSKQYDEWHIFTSASLNDKDWHAIQTAGGRSEQEDREWYANDLSFGTVEQKWG
jgi:sarcosine oxidase delta subunit